METNVQNLVSFLSLFIREAQHPQNVGVLLAEIEKLEKGQVCFVN
jgi:hypothetical protein